MPGIIQAESACKAKVCNTLVAQVRQSAFHVPALFITDSRNITKVDSSDILFSLSLERPAPGEN